MQRGDEDRAFHRELEGAILQQIAKDNGRDIANPVRPTCSRRRCARADELAKDVRLQQALES
jgi:hypothetical protein